MGTFGGEGGTVAGPTDARTPRRETPRRGRSAPPGASARERVGTRACVTRSTSTLRHRVARSRSLRQASPRCSGAPECGEKHSVARRGARATHAARARSRRVARPRRGRTRCRVWVRGRYRAVGRTRRRGRPPRRQRVEVERRAVAVLCRPRARCTGRSARGERSVAASAPSVSSASRGERAAARRPTKPARAPRSGSRIALRQWYSGGRRRCSRGPVADARGADGGDVGGRRRTRRSASRRTTAARRRRPKSADELRRCAAHRRRLERLAADGVGRPSSAAFRVAGARVASLDGGAHGGEDATSGPLTSGEAA